MYIRGFSPVDVLVICNHQLWKDVRDSMGMIKIRGRGVEGGLKDGRGIGVVRLAVRFN